MYIKNLEVLFHFFSVLIPSDGVMPDGSSVIRRSDLGDLLEITHKYTRSLEAVCEFISKESISLSNEGSVDLNDAHRIDILRSMESAIPEDFDMLIEVTYLLYYSKPEVHQLIKWDTNELAEKNQLKPFDKSILNVIETRKPFWRQC